MNLNNIPYKMLKVYQNSPTDLNKFTADPDNLTPMIYPKFGDFNDTFVRASVGLSSTKKIKNGLVCYNRIGIRHGCQNVYANNSNAFDILKADYLDMIDEDNVDGIECFNDFLGLKTQFMTRYNTEMRPLLDNIVTQSTMEVVFATPTKVSGFGYLYTLHSDTLNVTNINYNYYNGDGIASRRLHIEYPIKLQYTIKSGNGFNIALHPKKTRTNNVPKTVVMGLRRFNGNRHRYHSNTHNLDKSVVFNEPCLTEYNLTEGFEEFITAYNDVIIEFNDNIEKLKDKHAGLYMLNSIGLKSSTI